MKYKVVVFDLDGTLLDTLEDLKDAVNFALSSEALPQRSMDQVRQFVGNGIIKLMERAVGEKTKNFDKIMNEFRSYYQEHCNDHTEPYPGIMELLGELKKRGIQTAIVSNKADFAVQELTSIYFEALIDVSHGENEAAGIRKKPAPDMVLQALEELNCPVSDAIYVGDSDVDVETAHRTGLSCIGVSWGFRGKKFLEENGADEIIDVPSQLLDFLA